MRFIHEPLTWAFFLVIVPLLIHLINLVRQRRVKWAAMDFLLKSYKKHRRWVWLKQFLLLMARMVAIAAAVATLAKLVTDAEWTSIFSKKSTHHYVLLDDSLSMSDRAGSIEAFDLARQAVSRICAHAEKQGTEQKLSLLRFSQATRSIPTDGSASAVDISGETINSKLRGRLDDLNQPLDVSELAIGPLPAIELAEQLMSQATDERQVLHLISDFRAETWGQAARIRDTLQRLENREVDIRCVRCIEEQHPNLAITGLSAAQGTKSAGVPLFVDVKVKNFGPDPVRNARIEIDTQFFAAAVDGNEASPTAANEGLPDILIENLAAGETATRQIQAFFPTAGQHVVRASLVPDAVAADNQRWSVIDLPDGVPTLLIDDEPQQQTAYFLQSVFQPGTRTRTGIRPETHQATFLRDSSVEELSKFAVIYLVAFDQLDERSVTNLQGFVDAGGGLVIFLGPTAQARSMNDLYADGNGLLPIPIDSPAELPVAEDEGPDIVFHDHMIFRALRGDRNPFASGIRIAKYMKCRAGWKPAADSSIEILASLRNGDPLVVERPYGRGRVIVVATSADTSWNNWARDPTFIVSMLQTQAYLSSLEQEAVERVVGTPIQLQLGSSEFDPNVKYVLPSGGTAPGPTLNVAGTTPAKDSPVISFSIGQNPIDSRRTGETDRQGIYEAIATTLEGSRQFRRFALNVDTSESDLAALDRRQLAAKLDPIRVTIHDANDIVFGSLAEDGSSWSELLLGILVAVLLVEQFLAYLSSYHPNVAEAASFGVTSKTLKARSSR